MNELILLLIIIFIGLNHWIFSYFRCIPIEIRSIPFFATLFREEENAKRSFEVIDRIWFLLFSILLLYYLISLKEHIVIQALSEYFIISLFLIASGWIVGRIMRVHLSFDLMKKLCVLHLWLSVLFMLFLIPLILFDRQAARDAENTKNHENGQPMNISLIENRIKTSIPIPDWEDIIIKEIMVPRIEIAAIKTEATMEELYSLFQESKYSRIPVYTKDIDNIIGIVTLKDFLAQWSEDKRHYEISTLVRPVLFVPDTKKITTMLKDFKENKVSIAVVLNEYGGTAGLLTVHDIMENIIGEIKDEYDAVPEEGVVEVDGNYFMNGKMDIEMGQESIGLPIEEGDYETISGYIYSLIGRVPFAGEKIKTTDLLIEIIDSE